ncbi:MAG TPA: hypothetical protein VL100_00290 [Croceibacterium sp.]|nr:hypothetical protein [Croceibacterium sp.]
MGERISRQFFGPTHRHERACVEFSFPVDDRMYRLTPFGPELANRGLKLPPSLSDDPMPLEEAVCRLTQAILSLDLPWWSSHGREEGRGWSAFAYPLPRVSTGVLLVMRDLLQSDGEIRPALDAALRKLANWLAQLMRTRMRILASAEMIGLEAADVSISGEVYQIGQGSKGLHFNQAGNERDALTGTILEKKHSAIELLRRMDLPTTRAVVVNNERQALEVAAQVGFPCVVKPVSLDRGHGVSTGLRTLAQVSAAFAHARALSPGPVLVENHIDGPTYRLLVAGDELVWAYGRDPASVEGDGNATIAELVERENRRRATQSTRAEAYLSPIDTNQMGRFLADRYDLRLDSVLEKGRRIDVMGQTNVARGGLSGDAVRVHPDNRALAIRVSRLFRIGTMGMDLITPDISRSWKDSECAILELNRTPGTNGVADGMALLRALFPNRRSGRCPTIAVIGKPGFLARATAILEGAFARTGLRLTTGEYSQRTVPPEKSLSSTAPPVETLMLDPESDAALLLCEPDAVARLGFPLRHCDLLVIEDDQPPAWLARLAETVMPGAMSEVAIGDAVARLAELYADPAEGGPRPVLEPIAHDDMPGEFRIRVWRTRLMPRDWFWSHVGVAPADGEGLTTHEDLLAAVTALAGVPDGFVYDWPGGSWLHVWFDAVTALPVKGREKARAALLAATERVNQIAAMKIP